MKYDSLFCVMIIEKNPPAKSIFFFNILRLSTLFLVAALAVCTLASAQAPVPDSPAIEAKAHAMLSKLTLDQKIDLLGGVDGMYTRAVPAIGLPRLKMSDGPVGVRTWGPTTAYAAGAALAASWDPALARRVGEGLGSDARIRDVHFLLGPGMNIARSPLTGRNFEYSSEDPFLNAALMVPYIEGVQSQGVVATAKHFALNNEEYNRHNVSVDVDERTMREIYLPAFEAAVTKAHVDAVMNSYNLINGIHATQNEFLNLKVLKGEWGFQSILMSDWDATYDGIAAANNGLDLEMPNARFMDAQTLLAAVKSGAVKEATIDDKVMRLLRVALRYGFLDRPQFDPAAGSTYSVADRAIALDEAREGITLLKNDGHILPLDPAKLKTIAIIGPGAYPAVSGGGGSSDADAFEPVSTVTGIANVAGPAVHVLYDRGLPTINKYCDYTKWQSVHEETFTTKDFTGTPRIIDLREVSNFNKNWRQPDEKAPRSIRYTATFKAPEQGKYLLLAAAWSGDTYTVQVDGKQILSQPHDEGQVPHSKTIELTADQIVNIIADYVPSFPGNRFALGLEAESKLVTADALKFAAAADVVVVAAGFSPENEGESYDRTFEMPWGQDVLIEAIAAANPHTIVTLTGGGGMDTNRWLAKVPALLHTFYPGQEGGTAVGEILLGKRAPEGKLPVTFDRTWDENPSAKYYYPIAGADTSLHVTEDKKSPVDYVIPHLKYEDKLMVGYRYWTTTGQHPLFPFGFGLSYTTFNFSNLQVPAKAAAGSTVSVSFDVTNTGSKEGAEVAQLYLSDPSAKVSRPERELKGFEKVRLAPGETKHVTLSLDARAFSYWDETAHKWTIDAGKFVVRVGDSSEDTPLTAELTLNN